MVNTISIDDLSKIYDLATTSQLVEIKRAADAFLSSDRRPLPPKRLTRPELARVGVALVNREAHEFCCLTCGLHWWLDLSGGEKRWPRGYWHCPEECNH